MKIREIPVEAVAEGQNWLLVRGSEGDDLVDAEVVPCTDPAPDDTVVYSAISVLRTGAVRPRLLIREVGTYDWWGDTLERVGGQWRLLGQSTEWEGPSREFVASPLDIDPSFCGGDAPEIHRAGFAQYRSAMVGGSWA